MGGTGSCLHRDRLQEVERSLLGLVGGRGDLEGGAHLGAGGVAHVANDGAQPLDERREAVSGGFVLELLRMCFLQRGLRTNRRRDWVPVLPCHLVFVAKQEGSASLVHMPLHTVGEHAEKDVGPHTIFEMMANRPDVEVDGV